MADTPDGGAPRRVLVTGATGTVGSEVLSHLRMSGIEAVAGVTARHVDDPALRPAVAVDFLSGTVPDMPLDAVFLMRPPAIAAAEVFARFLEPLPRDVRIVFLSVAGAETAGYLPHAKIEAAVADMGFPLTAIRPVYFMDNLLTTLRADLEEDGRIVLPSGDLAFDWVSARDVAALAVAALIGREAPRAMTAAGGGHMGFAEVCARINATLGTGFGYSPVSMPRYVRRCRGRGMGWGQVGVMLLLHWLPRFGRRAPPRRGDIKAVLAHAPETLEAFAQRNADQFRTLGGVRGCQDTRSTITDPTE